MNDKLVAGLVTAALIAPICSLCFYGPAVFGVIGSALFGWMGWIDPDAALGFALIVGILAVAYSSRKHRNGPSRRKRATTP